jgi:hypothetical protein
LLLAAEVGRNDHLFFEFPDPEGVLAPEPGGAKFTSPPP